MHECTAWNPGGLTVSAGIEAEPFGALSIGGIPLHVVPDLQLEYVKPDARYQYFTDAAGNRIAPDAQLSLRAAVGVDTRFTDRSRWGDGFMLKAGVSCLLTSSVDLNDRREGCGKGDLDNWFVKSSFARNMAVTGGVSGFFRAEFWFEMPDHDFATKVVETPRAINHNDDGQYVVMANAAQYLFFPLERVIPQAEYFDFRLGIGAAHFLQKAQSAEAQPDPAFRKDHNVSTGFGEMLLSWNPLPEFSITGGTRWSKRMLYPDGYDGDQEYWTAQLFAEWRPDFSVF